MAAADEPLEDDDIEVGATRPPMWLGLPRKLSSLLVCLGGICWILIQPWRELAIALGTIAIVWGAVKVLVESDLHGFDIWLAHTMTSARALDAREWGGLRAAPLPLRSPFPLGISDAD